MSLPPDSSFGIHPKRNKKPHLGENILDLPSAVIKMGIRHPTLERQPLRTSFLFLANTNIESNHDDILSLSVSFKILQLYQRFLSHLYTYLSPLSLSIARPPSIRGGGVACVAVCCSVLQCVAASCTPQKRPLECPLTSLSGANIHTTMHTFTRSTKRTFLLHNRTDLRKLPPHNLSLVSPVINIKHGAKLLAYN